MTAADIEALPTAERVALLLRGHPIDPDALADTEYDGVSLGLPRFVERLTWKRFRKAFHRDPQSGQLRGWNIRIDNTRPGWQPMQRRGGPVTFGHFAVRPAAGYRMPRPAHGGLVLDYDRGNGRFTPIRLTRDALVAVHPGDATLLLGWLYLDLGFASISTPSLFTLTRAGALTATATPASF